MIKEIFIDFARPFLFLYTMLIPSQKYVTILTVRKFVNRFWLKKKLQWFWRTNEMWTLSQEE